MSTVRPQSHGARQIRRPLSTSSAPWLRRRRSPNARKVSRCRAGPLQLPGAVRSRGRSVQDHDDAPPKHSTHLGDADGGSGSVQLCMARASVATQLLRGRALASASTACAAGIAFCAARNIPGEKSTPTIGPRGLDGPALPGPRRSHSQRRLPPRGGSGPRCPRQHGAGPRAVADVRILTGEHVGSLRYGVAGSAGQRADHWRYSTTSAKVSRPRYGPGGWTERVTRTPVDSTPSEAPPLSPRSLQVLMRAQRRAASRPDPKPSADDLFVALLDQRGGASARLFDEASVDRDAVRAMLAGG